MRLALLVVFVAVVAACGAPQFPLPMTAAQLQGYDSGPALVAYLGQADATPTVCDLRARGPHLSLFDDDKLRWLVRGLTDGQIAPELWRRCANSVLNGEIPDVAAALLDAVGRGYRALIRRSDFESAPAMQARLLAAQRLYIERKNGIDGHARADEPLVAELRQALDRHRLGPIATRMGDELVAAVDLEHGRWLDRPVDAAVIDRLFAAGDESALRRFVDRLPQAALRDAARRRVIRLHIAASPFAEVRQNAAVVEEQLAAHGTNALSLAEHPPVRGFVDAAQVPWRGVLVRQQLTQQTATLYGFGADGPNVSVLPELKLRGALYLELGGVSRPVTLCAPPRELDPSPCVAAHDIHLDNPAAYLDQGGAFHFVEHIGMHDAVGLARMRDRFAMPVSAAGKTLVQLEWRLVFERPDDLVFTGDTAALGPALGVGADRRDPDRFIFSVAGPGGTWLAVVEAADLMAFHVISRGGRGQTGFAGASGASGASGGECQNGGDGGPGGSGGPGGPGGDGGEVAVRVVCGRARCDDVIAQLRGTVLSQGGFGGAGGAGGAGGPGGSGGPGRSPTTHTDENGNTVTDDPGCSAGSSGSSGSPGASGPSGPPGNPGTVRWGTSL